MFNRIQRWQKIFKEFDLLAIIQCRTSSKRFPGKALFKIKSIPLILRVYTQVKKSRLIKDILVATSRNKSDNKLSKFLKKKI